MKRKGVKFIQQFETKMLRTIEKEAKKRSINMQQMIRAVIIPEWLTHQPRKRKK
ncbi:MAG TPA: hypothetical protein VF910_07675 [Candidatus Bathyarchaeia archaeon]